MLFSWLTEFEDNALIQNNADIGSQIAAELYQFRSTRGKSYLNITPSSTSATYKPAAEKNQSTNPVS